MDNRKRIAIFGTGDFGRKAYGYFGEDKVAVFIDNNVQKQGGELFGVRIVSLEEYLTHKDEYELVIAVRDNEAIIRQLIENGFKDVYSFLAVSTTGLLHKVSTVDALLKKDELRRRDLHKRGIDIKENKWDICLTGLYTELNYGAELTCLALYGQLNSMGYTVLMNQPPLSADVRPNRFPPLFKENPYPVYDLGRVFDDTEDMKELNEYVKYFVLGSDQMWNREIICDRGNVSYMEFADSGKGLLSYATSFGKASWDEDMACTAAMQRCLDKFFAVSVREGSGVEICKNFGVQAVRCMDPVFLCDREFYHRLAEKSELQTVNNAASVYIFCNDKSYTEAIEKFAERNRLMLNVIKPVSMFAEDWLRQIEGSRILITNSFHAICFAVIFGIDFVAVEFKWSARIYELLKMLGLEKRIVHSITEINERDELQEAIDYSRVYEILNEEIGKSKAWLKNRLEEMEKKYE